MARGNRGGGSVRGEPENGPSADEPLLAARNLLRKGRLEEAFGLFLSAAEAGDTGAQLNVGYLYDTGQGVRASRTQALYWYRKAFRQGKAEAATNIAAIYRDEGRLRLALRWFEKAVALGDSDALLDMAALQGGPLKDAASARRLLSRVLRSKRVNADSRERAERLLHELEQRQRRAR